MTSTDTSSPTTEPAAVDHDHGDGGETTKSGRAWLWVLGVSIGAVVVALGAVLLAVGLGGGSSSATYRYTVPPGTAARAAQGETVNIMPRVLNVKVGDHLIIENQDDATMTVGPYTVRAGETLDQRFGYAGDIIGACSLQKDGEIVIRVSNRS